MWVNINYCYKLFKHINHCWNLATIDVRHTGSAYRCLGWGGGHMNGWVNPFPVCFYLQSMHFFLIVITFIIWSEQTLNFVTSCHLQDQSYSRHILSFSSWQCVLKDRPCSRKPCYVTLTSDPCRQGIDTMDRRQVDTRIDLSEVPFVMRALGFYPSEQEV